jgi:DNA-binding winged helix-turn-helix (wHTH) protein
MGKVAYIGFQPMEATMTDFHTDAAVALDPTHEPALAGAAPATGSANDIRNVEMKSCPACGRLTDEHLPPHVDLDTGLAMVNGVFLQLKPRAAELLWLLIERKGADHDYLIRGLWGGQEPASPMEVLRIHVVHLRKQLKPTGATIESVWGRGYRLINAHRLKRPRPGEMRGEEHAVDRRALPDLARLVLVSQHAPTLMGKDTDVHVMNHSQTDKREIVCHDTKKGALQR